MGSVQVAQPLLGYDGEFPLRHAGGLHDVAAGWIGLHKRCRDASDIARRDPRSADAVTQVQGVGTEQVRFHQQGHAYAPAGKRTAVGDAHRHDALGVRGNADAAVGRLIRSEHNRVFSRLGGKRFHKYARRNLHLAL